MLFFKCINISDVQNIEKIFEILGIQLLLSVDIILTVYSLYTELGRSDTVLFSNI